MTPLEMIAEWRKGCTIAGPLAVDAGIGEGGPEECEPCTVGLIDAMQKHLETMLPHVRALRLWHWRMVLKYREFANGNRCVLAEPAASQAAGLNDKQADWHLSCVQTLNDFFPVGDTAEGDAAKETK